MSDNRQVAKDLIIEAADTIINKRPGVHGSAEQSFDMIANLWTVYIRHVRRVRGHDELRAEDVAEMMALLKKARKVYGDSKNRDNDVDDIGYTALAGMLRLPDPDNPEKEIDKMDVGTVPSGSSKLTPEQMDDIIRRTKGWKPTRKSGVVTEPLSKEESDKLQQEERG